MKISREKLAGTLKKVFLFSDLNTEELDLLVSKCQVLFFAMGKMVYLEQTPANNLYVNYEGSIEVLKEKNNTLPKLKLRPSMFRFSPIDSILEKYVSCVVSDKSKC